MAQSAMDELSSSPLLLCKTAVKLCSTAETFYSFFIVIFLKTFTLKLCVRTSIIATRRFF